MSRPDPEAVERLLSRRRTLLERVQHGPVPKPSLVEDVSSSRSTVDRAVRELESARLVRRTPDGVVLTLAGRVALERYRRYQSSLGDLARATDVLSELPADAAFDPSLVDGATVVNPERHEPRLPTRTMVRDLRDARRIRAIVVGYVPDVIAALLERVVGSDVEGEVVVTPEGLKVVVRHHASVLDDALRNGLRLFSADVPDAPYSLLLSDRADGTAVSVSVSRDGAITGLIRNEDDAATDWAARRFDRVRRDADEIRD